MKENVIIRNERKEDWEIVETITRQAFYNLYVPGCVEHYLVHNMREHEDFISELDFVLELNGNVIGNIMYTKAKLIDENKNKKDMEILKKIYYNTLSKDGLRKNAYRTFIPGSHTVRL